MLCVDDGVGVLSQSKTFSCVVLFAGLIGLDDKLQCLAHKIAMVCAVIMVGVCVIAERHIDFYCVCLLVMALFA